MKALRSIPALGAFFVLAALIVAGCGSSSSNSIPKGSVAVVAGNPISAQAFNHWIYVDAKGEAAQSPGQPVIVPNDPPAFTKCIANVKKQIPSLAKTADATLKADCSQLFTSLSSQVMDFLIRAYWYQGLAHTLGVTVTPAQLQAALAKDKKAGGFSTAAAYANLLKESGETNADVVYRVRVSALFAKLVKRHPTTVTTADIAAYYAAHKSSYGSPERLNVRIVLAKTQANAVAAKAALTHGQSWDTVAKKYSIDPTTKDKGGLLTGITAGEEDQALSKAAFAAPLNKLEGPVKGQFGYYILDVIKQTAATQKTLAQSSAAIKKALTAQKATAAQTAINKQAESLYKSKTKCEKYYAMADCSNYVKPKTTATSTAPSSGATTTAAPTTTAPATSTSSSASSSAGASKSSKSSKTKTSK